MPHRPYQKLRAEDLCNEGERLLSLGENAKLRDLLEELSYRTKSRKKLDQLAKKIEIRLSMEASGTKPEAIMMPTTTLQSKRKVSNKPTDKKNNDRSSGIATKEENAEGAKADLDYLERYPLPVKELASVHQIRACGSELTGVPDPWVKKLAE